MAHAALPAAPRAPRLLRATLLLLLLLVAADRRAAGESPRQPTPHGTPLGRRCAPRAALLTESLLPTGAPAPPELRCQCLQMVQGIHSKILQSFNITPPGPNCDRTEVM